MNESINLIAWLAEPATLPLPVVFTEPLSWLGLTPKTNGGTVLTGLLNFYAWSTAARTLYAAIGRGCGFYNPAHFQHFLWIPWRPVWRTASRVLIWWEEIRKIGVRATGGWASLPGRLCLTYRPGDIFLGLHRAWGFTLLQPAGIDDERHVAIIAGPGSGKTSHAISWVVTHPGNAFIIDPKGLIARVTARRKGQGGPGVFGQGKTVRILDPLHQVKDHLTARLNLFDLLHKVEDRSGRDAVVRYIVNAGAALVMTTGKETNPFWAGISRDVISGAIADIYLNEPRANQHLPRLYELFSHGLPDQCRNPKESPIAAWLWRMKNTKGLNGIAAGAANALTDSGKETYGNILVTIKEHLQWLKLPEVANVCRSGSAADGTDVDLEALVTGDLVLYLCAPATDIRGPLAGWFRLLTVMSLYIFEDLQKKLRYPTLFLLDEFPALGKISSIQVAAGLMRSMSVRLAIIAQDLGQLRIYDNHEAFVGSATTLFMGSSHQETLSYIERAAGLKTVQRRVEGGWMAGKPARHELREEPVIRAEAAKRLMGRGNIIVMRPDERPLITRRTRYFDYAPTCFFEQDHDHREPLLRQLTRGVFTLLHPGPANDGRRQARIPPAPGEA